MNLDKLGWNKQFENEFNRINKDDYIPARVVREEKGHYLLQHNTGVCTAQVSGKLRYKVINLSDYPSVGDWVSIKLINDNTEAIIYAVLTRKSSFTRKAAISGGRKVRDVNNRKITFGGSTEEQVVAANIDTIFIVTAADDNYNLRRLERYLLLAYNSGATPVIVLNKIDMCENINQIMQEINNLASGVPVHYVSAINNEGIDELKQYLDVGVTIGLFGSSGVGKSTIINCFLGKDEKLLTGAIRDRDQKGRHTTTWRELIVLPTGGILIDTPGMRELQVWSNSEELDSVFDDIKALEKQCKFNDCSHNNESDCAIKNALNSGELDRKRYDNYLIMDIEVSYLSNRLDEKTKYYSKREIFRNKIVQKSKNYKY